MKKTRYALVGTGGRGIGMFAKPLVNQYADVAELVGLCDINPKRLEVAVDSIGQPIPTFTDFDQMLAEIDCDVVIVATKDSTHHEFIIKALEAGKDAITEKPMTVDDEKCRQILEAEERTGRSVRVTFNYRYAPYATKVKELLVSGAIGDIYSVDFHWFLDTVHGADYFRRWHRQKANSGGLFVHKATHHFDLINWWLADEPKTVYASGTRRFYGPTREERGERCLTCDYKNSCEFYFDLGASDNNRRLYLEAEGEDGYIRDRCVFADEIDIEDTMAALVQYAGGAQLTYSLHAYTPFEGYRVTFNGSKGRLEAGVGEAFAPQEHRVLAERQTGRRRLDPILYLHGQTEPGDNEIRIYPVFGGAEAIRVPHGGKGHGGGDRRLLDMLFRPNVPDPLGHAAGSRAGAMSILVGVAANHSMERRGPVEIDELLGGLQGSVPQAAS